MLQHFPAAFFVIHDISVLCMQVWAPVTVPPKAMHVMMATQPQRVMCAMHNWHVLV